jgi:colicin import membrane protein
MRTKKYTTARITKMLAKAAKLNQAASELITLAHEKLGAIQEAAPAPVKAAKPGRKGKKSAPEAKPTQAIPAGVKMKKDGTPDQRSLKAALRKTKAEGKVAKKGKKGKAAKVKAVVAVPAGVKMKKDGTPDQRSLKAALRKAKAEGKVAKKGKKAAKAKAPKAKAPKVAIPAGVKMKKDGTPDQRSLKAALRKAKAAKKPAKAKAAKKPAKAKAAKAPAGVRLKKDGTPAKKPGRKSKSKEPSDKEAHTQSGKEAQEVQAIPEGVKLKKDGTPDQRSMKAALRKSQTGDKPEPDTKSETTPRKGRKGANGQPVLKDALIKVLGNDTLNLDEIQERLKENNWLPSSSEPRKYIGFVLSQTKDIFDPAPEKGRGYYRVKGAPKTSGTAKAAEGPADKPADKPAKPDKVAEKPADKPAKAVVSGKVQVTADLSADPEALTEKSGPTDSVLAEEPEMEDALLKEAEAYFPGNI